MPDHAMKFTVAIDGPAAAGKGTISKAIAAHFNLAHLDTGLLYRAVGRKAMDSGQPPEAIARALGPADLLRDDLRTAQVAQAASRLAAIPEVRAALVDFQRNFAKRDGGAILDGRDIGTVICPNADVKLYVTADAPTRAARRFEELSANGQETSFDTVLADVIARDARDAGRAEAPMVAADDAVLIDTTELSIDQAVAQAIKAVASRYHP
jgi:cytidylate kinase